MPPSTRFSSYLSTSIAFSLAVASAACGGKTLEPTETGSGPDGTLALPGMTPPSPTSNPQNPPTEPSGPALPTSPFTPKVDTTDVSILYPLPVRGESNAFLRPTDGGSLGALLPRAVFEQVARAGLDFELPSGYESLRLVSLRLDPCAARETMGRGCTSEIRAVFQGLSEDAKTGTTVAADGGVHVAYDVSDLELGETLAEVLTAKLENGNAGSSELGPHPILSTQGLSGAFATRLRAIALRHLGEARIARVTAFDHNLSLDSDGWTFGIFERKSGSLVAGTIPGTKQSQQTIGGSSAHVSLVDSSAESLSGTLVTDSVGKLVTSSRPMPGTQAALALPAVFEASIRIENPLIHHSESTDCANCHLAEGARRIGAVVYGLSSSNAYSSARGVTRRDERTSVTNLHAFGYLGRQVSIMQRTANESARVAERMEARLVPR